MPSRLSGLQGTPEERTRRRVTPVRPAETGADTVTPSGDKIAAAALAVRALRRLAAAFQAGRLYRFDASTDETIRHFLELHARYAERYGSLTVGVTRSSLILDFERIERKDPLITPLAQSLHTRGIRRLSMLPGVLPGEIRHFLKALTAPWATVRLAGGVGHLLREHGVGRIVLEETAALEEDPLAIEPSLVPRAFVATILRRFVTASKNTHLYPAGHPMIEKSVEELRAAIAQALQATASIRYDIRDGAVFHEKELLDMDALFVKEFVDGCAAHRIGRLTFHQGITSHELAHAVSLFVREPMELVVEGGFSQALRARHVTHMVAG